MTVAAGPGSRVLTPERFASGMTFEQYLATVVVLLVGFLVLQEPLTWGRLAAIGMIVGGTLLYQRQGR